jgi:hypothetical protein
MFYLLADGLALRRVVPFGRIWRRDPAGAAHFADERSHMSAVVGLVVVAGALAGVLITSMANVVAS